MATGPADRIALVVGSLLRSGIFNPLRPDQAARVLLALRKWDRTPAAGAASMGAVYPDDRWIVDELGDLTFIEVDHRTNALASSLHETGIKAGDRVGLLCRNHRYFVESTVALSKLGAVTLLLNTDFAAPQLAGVLEREKPVAVIADAEFDDLLDEVADRVGEVPRYTAWAAGPSERPTLEEMIGPGSATAPAPPPEPGRMTILSSGTTGTPKGVQRGGTIALAPLLGYIDRIGLKTRHTQIVASPMFHGWGLLHLGLSFLLGTTVVLRRRFDPEETLELIAKHRADAAPMVPVMLQRIMELPAEVRARYETGSLHSISLGGSAVPGDLATRAMDEFGDVVYNTYGSTEVANASTATPADLRADPATAGKPLPGSDVRILDDGGAELPPGETGRIFVGSELRSEGYSGGGGKEEIEGLLSSGDLGHFDAEGRLFIDGREDEMIVSGGENVFPGEVEDLLSSHPAIAEAAVVGIDDAKFGQRMRAFVALRNGEQLTVEEVRTHVKENLARYKVPRDVEFVDELPRNPTGKVLKRELA